MAEDNTADRKRKYQELDALIQEISAMEGVPENGVVTQWAVVAGVVAFNEDDDYVENDVICLTPNAGMTTPVWQIKGLLDSGITKYRALEQASVLECNCEEDE